MTMEVYTDQRLVSMLVSAMRREKEATESRGRVEQEIHRRLEERGGRKLLGSVEDVILTPASPNYDHAKLRRELGENVDPNMWDSAFTPEHPSTARIAAKFNMTKLKAMATMHGKPVQNAMDLARLPDGPGHLKVERKE